jgi:adenylate cyclase
MAQRFGRGDQGSFGIGIGLHTGVAVIGNIGSKKRMEYTAIGDTVNVASRLESLTKSLGVTIAASKATLDAAGVEVLTGRHSVEHVKGRSEAIEVFEVIGLKDGAS